MEAIPPLSVDLIKNLDSEYPIVYPHPSTKRDDELYMAGQRSVVSHLLELLKDT